MSKKIIDSINLNEEITWKVQVRLLNQSVERCANKTVIVDSILVGNHYLIIIF